MTHVLDQRTAKLVCRRDLARAQRRQNTSDEPIPPQGDVTNNDVSKEDHSIEKAVDRDNDHDMTNTTPDEAETIGESLAKPPSNDPEVPRESDQASGTPDARVSNESTTANANNLPSSQPTNTQDTIDPKQDVPTNADAVTLDDSSELDALFNDPGSTQASRDDDVDGDKQNSAVDFDFSAFGANGDDDDNDNISALLPGLQDYANAPTVVEGGTGDPELDAIFGTGPVVQMNGSQEDPFGSSARVDDFLDFGDFGDASTFSANNSGDQNMEFSFD